MDLKNLSLIDIVELMTNFNTDAKVVSYNKDLPEQICCLRNYEIDGSDRYFEISFKKPINSKRLLETCEERGYSVKLQLTDSQLIGKGKERGIGFWVVKGASHTLHKIKNSEGHIHFNYKDGSFEEIREVVGLIQEYLKV